MSRGLGVLGFLRYIGFQSQNASFRATCEQKGREEKCWMLWFLLNQWSTGPTGVPEKLKQSETVGNSRKQSETVGNSRERPGVIVPKLSIRHFFAKKKRSAQSPFKVHFLYKLVLNSSFFAESKVRAPTVSNCFPLHFQKKRGLRGTFFLQKKWRIDNFGTITPDCFRLFPTVSDCFRLFPTVSDCFSFSGKPVGPVDHWFNKNHNIQHFSSRPFCSQVARNDAFWLWNPIYRKNPKTPRPREI